MVRVTASFVNEVLWPEFLELNGTLRAHLDSVTSNIIKRAIHANEADVEGRTEQATNTSDGQALSRSVSCTKRDDTPLQTDVWC